LLHTASRRVGADVPGCADLGIELCLISLASAESASRHRIRRLRRVAADHRGRRRAQRGDIFIDSRACGVAGRRIGAARATAAARSESSRNRNARTSAPSESSWR